MKITSFCGLLLIFGLAKANDSRVVNLAQGPVRGYRDSGEHGDLFAFHGIPYATAPTGVHKFKAPKPGPFWTDTLDAVNKNIICPQNKMFLQMGGNVPYEMKEDCLVASVFVPDTKETNLPVLVIVHGGAYQIGFGNMMSPESLVTKGNIIAVTFNYRLSIHGFLCLGTEGAPGNAGMKDMVALLRWVKSNIASFGGNPDDVTIDGFSAGSSAVDHLFISETTKGLFHKVIPESGTAMGPWGVAHDPLQIAKTYAKSLNFISDDVYALEEFYQTASFETLTADVFLHDPTSTFTFAPCIERDTGIERFLKDSPYNILKTGNYEKLPVLFGFSKNEGMFRLDVFNNWKDKMNERFEDFLPTNLQFKDKQEKKSVAAKVKKFYFGDKPVSEDTVRSYVDYFGDVIFGYPTIQSARLQVEAGSDSVFLYEFDFYEKATEAVYAMQRSVKFDGANHCAQSFTTFDTPMFGNFPKSDDFMKMRETMRELWINFIKTGQPIPKGSSVLGGSWPAVGADGSPHMALDRISRLESGLLKERVTFWDEIYDKHYRDPIPPPEPKRRRVEL